MRTTILIFLILSLGTMTASADTFRIELDYMVDGGAGGHSHQPSQAVIDAVVQMFACQGHTLIIDVSDAVPHDDLLAVNPTTGSFFAYADVDSSYGSIKNSYYDHAGQGGWHYCLFAHDYALLNGAGVPANTGSSGLAETPGDDLVVTLGSFLDNSGVPIGTPFDQAATLAHEFGHNLGLSHCGNMVCGNDSSVPNWVGPRVPNVASVMSYAFQLLGVRSNLVCQGLSVDYIPFKDLDYSHGSMCTLDERALDEGLGTLLAAVDWNCDGVIGGVVQEDLISGERSTWCATADGTRSILSDYDEWSNIVDVTKNKLPSELNDQPFEVCITAEQVKVLRKKATCALPALTGEACLVAETRYVRDGGAATSGNRCVDPYGSVGTAVGGAPSGSVIVLEPGDFPEGPRVINNQLFLHSAGRAVIR
jgi:hypothetical protein